MTLCPFGLTVLVISPPQWGASGNRFQINASSTARAIVDDQVWKPLKQCIPEGIETFDMADL